MHCRGPARQGHCSPRQALLSRGRPAKWAPGTVRDAHNNWVRFMAWLERNGIEHDGWIFDAIDLGDYLFEVDASARAKAGANKAKAGAASRAAANGSAPPPKRKYQDGSTAVTGVVKNLHLLRTHFGFTLPIEEADSPRLPGSKATQATPALTLGIVFRLYRFVNVVAEVQRRGTKQPFERLAHASASLRPSSSQPSAATDANKRIHASSMVSTTASCTE